MQIGKRRRRCKGTVRTGAVLLLLAAAGGGDAVGQGRAEWCPEPEAAQFDFWLGEWDVRNLNRPSVEAPWAATGTATNRVYAVVGGCAVVEHWRGYAFPSAGHIVGFSVRAWDPASEQWRLVLLWPIGGASAFGSSRGTFTDGRGRFTRAFVNPAGDSVIASLNFYDIEPDGFRWSNGVSRDDGETWVSTWIMEFARRAPTATGLWNGPGMTTDRCPGPEHRGFDSLLGEWTGVRRRPDGSGAAVRTHLVRILNGCAVMERTWREDGDWEAFRVRAYEPDAGGWAEYALASDRRALHRRSAGAGTDVDGLVFTDEEAVGGVYLRTRWRVVDGGIRIEEDSAPGPAGPWTRLAETRYDRRVGQGGGGGP